MAAGRRAQVSMEFLFVLAISIVIITLIALLAQGQMGTVQKQRDAADAQNSLLDLSAAAKEVYAQGEGSRKLVFVQLPSGYEANRSFVGNRSIQIRADGTDYVSLEDFNVRGYLPTAPGRYWVWVTSEGSRVRIGLAMMEFSSNRVYVVMERNATATESFSVKNTWIRNITVYTSTLWNASEVSMDGVPAGFSLDLDGTQLITLEFASAPDSGGFYLGEITLDATDGQGATEAVSIPVTVYVIGADIVQPDLAGPVITSIYQWPSPGSKFEPLLMTVVASDEATGNNTIKSCEISADLAAWEVMEAVDGAYDTPAEAAQHNYSAGFDLGIHSMRARCTDVANNTGPIAYYFFNMTEADELGPIVIEMHHTEYPTTLSNVSVGGTATDAYTGNSDVASCLVKLDSGEWVNAPPDDGAYDSPTENFTYNAGVLPVGYHVVYYLCTDSLGNVGGIYNDSFGVVDVDLMLVLDRSGSMDWNVTNATSSTSVSAASTGWSWVKNLSVTEKNGDIANFTVELRSTVAGCLSSYNITINGLPMATDGTMATSYTYLTGSMNISQFEPPFQVALWLKRNASGCSAYNRFLSVQQAPRKLYAAQSAAKTFLDISGSATYAGLVSYSTSATTDRQLAVMEPANQQALKDAIDALVASGGTCIECGLKYGADELTSVRGRPTATRVIVMLTDGQGNAGDSIAGAVYCRDRNVTVYTIGFGNDVDDVELTNIALLTHGDYYFAPNAETLTSIFMNIGK